MTSGNRVQVGWALLAGWTILIGWWAITPLTETLTVRQADGTELIGPEGDVVRVELECGAPVARDIGTPAVAVPQGATLPRPVCERTQTENRVLLWINLGVIAAASVAMIAVTLRARADQAEPAPS